MATKTRKLSAMVPETEPFPRHKAALAVREIADRRDLEIGALIESKRVRVKTHPMLLFTWEVRPRPGSLLHEPPVFDRDGKGRGRNR